MKGVMRRTTVAVLAAAILAVVVGTASAARFSVSNQSFRVVWASLAFEAGVAGTIRCGVTLEGSFHSRTFAKSTGALIGSVTRARMQQPCTNGSLAILNGIETGSVNSLPWHVRYDSFEGSLPSVTAVRLQFVGFGYFFTILGRRCLYVSTAERPIYGTYFPGAEEEIFRRPPAFAVEGRLSEDVSGCLATMGVEGRSRLTVLGGTEEVRLVLA